VSLIVDICKEIQQKTGLTITEFARQQGVSRQTFYDSLHSNGSRKIRVAIAITLETSPIELFDYKDDDHKRLLDVYEYEKVVKLIHRPAANDVTV